MAVSLEHLAPEQIQMFEESGYIVVRHLLAPAEVQGLIDNFMEIHQQGARPGFFEPVSAEQADGDILKQYPRIMHPHRFNDMALRYLLDSRLAIILEDLFGEEPLAAQSMLYFKPAGGRGQALHQDNFFLRVEPGTCIAAWIALDRVDRENGGLEVVPGTQKMNIFCPEEADETVSFTRDYVPVPAGLEAVPVDMEPGDVLFFNGSLVHGSQPNTSQDRYRRSFICHYIGRSSERMSIWYRPILTMSGEEVAIAENADGGPCGTEFGMQGPH
ncbi:protein involved in biosynthesis of mitomycin antibiotics/polyketide fumonisin [Dictyobacter alpinus]|uniref:Protein involved in biosynthesis of mitomycin antibiotics/polyketide fumonisin n=1 Tax=Dictyobacter alpinus TaxID=2014873 RepID=A0A402AZZ1_9CHLR|nr:phytanoyl-CoA dioxygenase family protein [Dictyobacter alpinus]GCE24655.1 protein involved in biosynthesis of mitomycin antibiotics/polyketide fumonisin [Dictyobacter alpinus]